MLEEQFIALVHATLESIHIQAELGVYQKYLIATKLCTY